MTFGLRSAALGRLHVSVRDETDDDLDWLRALYAATREGELAILSWPPAAKASFVAEQFRLQRHHVLTQHPHADRLVVCVMRQRVAVPVGRLYLDRTMRPWRIVDVALVPDARGRGIGAALLRAVQAAAGDAGIDLHVRHDNGDAARLYARLGFAGVFGASATHRRMVWTGRPASGRVS